MARWIACITITALLGCATWQPIGPGAAIDGEVRVVVRGNRTYVLEDAHADADTISGHPQDLYGNTSSKEVVLLRSTVTSVEGSRVTAGATGRVLLGIVLLTALVVLGVGRPHISLGPDPS
jgi:hypothetical protein